MTLARKDESADAEASPKMSHAPYMSVVLSTRPLPHLLANKEISYVLNMPSQTEGNH